MLKVLATTINVIAAGYVIYMIGGAVYEKGREDGQKILDEDFKLVTDGDGNPKVRMIDGVMYIEVVKK